MRSADMIARLTLELPEDVARVRKVRRVAACLLEDEPVTPEEAEDVELVIGEICANVVRHARSEEGCYQVTLELYTDRLGVTVVDQGRGFDPFHVPPPGTERHDAELAELVQRFGGLGLPLAEALTDRLVFRPTDPERPSGARGMTVYAEKAFQGRGVGAVLGQERQGNGQDEQPEELEGAREPQDPGGLLYDCVNGDRSVAVFEYSCSPSEAAAVGPGAAGVDAAGNNCRFEIYVNGEPVATVTSQMEAEQEARRIAERGIVPAAEAGSRRGGKP